MPHVPRNPCELVGTNLQGIKTITLLPTEKPEQSKSARGALDRKLFPVQAARVYLVGSVHKRRFHHGNCCAAGFSRRLSRAVRRSRQEDGIPPRWSRRIRRSLSLGIEDRSGNPRCGCVGEQGEI